MSKFRKGGKKEVGEISTASLPDIVFMLLFFFMIVTVIKEDDPLVKVEQPRATEVTKIEKKELVDYINIGVPQDARFGTEPVIQLDDAIAGLDDIRQWILDNKDERFEAEQPKIVTSLKVDKDAEMGIVGDVKYKLREAEALKILYSTLDDSDE
ncbi:MAG: biopolymer transporter ExbD [Bacteroidota bacterium]